jgi:hypothetical protein
VNHRLFYKLAVLVSTTWFVETFAELTSVSIRLQSVHAPSYATRILRGLVVFFWNAPRLWWRTGNIKTIHGNQFAFIISGTPGLTSGRTVTDRTSIWSFTRFAVWATSVYSTRLSLSRCLLFSNTGRLKIARCCNAENLFQLAYVSRITKMVLTCRTIAGTRRTSIIPSIRNAGWFTFDLWARLSCCLLFSNTGRLMVARCCNADNLFQFAYISRVTKMVLTCRSIASAPRTSINPMWDAGQFTLDLRTRSNCCLLFSNAGWLKIARCR